MEAESTRSRTFREDPSAVLLARGFCGGGVGGGLARGAAAAAAPWFSSTARRAGGHDRAFAAEPAERIRPEPPRTCMSRRKSAGGRTASRRSGRRGASSPPPAACWSSPRRTAALATPALDPSDIPTTGKGAGGAARRALSTALAPAELPPPPTL